MRKVLTLVLAAIFSVFLLGCGDGAADDTTISEEAVTDVEMGLDAPEQEAYDFVTERYSNKKIFEVTAFGRLVLESPNESASFQPPRIGEESTVWFIQFSNGSVAAGILYQDGTETDLSHAIADSMSGTEVNFMSWASEEVQRETGSQASLEELTSKVAELSMAIQTLAIAAKNGVDVSAVNEALNTYYFTEQTSS